MSSALQAGVNIFDIVFEIEWVVSLYSNYGMMGAWLEGKMNSGRAVKWKLSKGTTGRISFSLVGDEELF